MLITCRHCPPNTIHHLQFDDQGELSLTEDLHDDIPPYTILSHTWGDDKGEVDFDDLKHKSFKKQGRLCEDPILRRARRRRTTSITSGRTHAASTKANNTQYSEAINSMFRWYRRAVKCYVYMADVSIPDGEDPTERTWVRAFRRSRWLTRGWTLQELLAPASVEFFSREG